MGTPRGPLPNDMAPRQNHPPRRRSARFPPAQWIGRQHGDRGRVRAQRPAGDAAVYARERRGVFTGVRGCSEAEGAETADPCVRDGRGMLRAICHKLRARIDRFSHRCSSMRRTIGARIRMRLQKRCYRGQTGSGTTLSKAT